MIQCTKCQTPISNDRLNTPQAVACESCDSRLEIQAFPALFRPDAPGRTGQALLADSEAGCFYHGDKRAVRTCEGCGRFLCELCDVAFNSLHLCPVCLEAGIKKRKIKNTENHRTLYDSIALGLAFFPMVFVFITCITAPLALYMSIRYWKRPTSILPRTKIRYILAMVFALVQIGGWSTMIYAWTI